jgi:hypothetical protein
MSPSLVGSRRAANRPNASSKACLYFACSDHRIRNNCLGECHNEHTRNWKESHVLRKRAVLHAMAPLSSNTVRSEPFPVQTSAKWPPGKSPAISALRVSHAGHESYFSRRTTREPFAPLPYCQRSLKPSMIDGNLILLLSFAVLV